MGRKEQTTSRPFIWAINILQTTDPPSHNKNAQSLESDLTVHRTGDMRRNEKGSWNHSNQGSNSWVLSLLNYVPLVILPESLIFHL